MSRLLLAALLLASAAIARGDPPKQAIIPQPVRLEQREGAFALQRCSRIVVDKEPRELLAIGRRLARTLGRITGRDVTAETSDGVAPGAPAVLLTTADTRKGLGEEGYELDVSPELIVIRAAKPAGLSYGAQTLLQLAPAKTEAPGGSLECEIPCLHIEDYPRFAWRGMHLDVARHFFDKEFVKRYIDYLAWYKINVFHLYLTDDQGWRIEIKRYPRLTEVGAWRSGTAKHTSAGEGDQKRYGGFYTQDDIREIVRYAAERHITIVPGISMPGHSQAALASYPELSSDGKPVEVWTHWGISDHFMDPGKEEVFQFVEGVLTEVIDLFPGPYVHCGGDEVRRKHWEASPWAQARIKQEGLKSVDELQSYFTRRVERFLNSKGRRLVGWDEILEGGLAPNAVVMSWRGTAGGIAAAKAGHQVVMTPNKETYFNYMQHREKKGPGHTAFLPLLNVYHFDPALGLTAGEAKYVLGGQACLWTEYVPSSADVEYLLFPRLLAMAEVLWSPASGRDDEDFRARVAEHLTRLKQAGVRVCQLPED